GGSGSEREAIDAWVSDLGVPMVAAEQLDKTMLGDEGPQGDYTCSKERWDETRQFDRITAVQANAQSLYPGALVGADALSTGLLAPKILPRAPLRFSASLEGVLDGAVSATVDKPSLSSFRDALHDILAANVVGSTAAHVFADIQEVYSSEQLELAVGVSGSWGFGLGEVSTSLEFDRTEVKSRYVVEFVQSYYTVDVDPPETPSGLFAPEVDVDDVEAEFGAEAPAYVASVSYGRMVLFTITSELSAEELGAALEFAYHGVTSVDGNVSLSHEEVLANSHITAFVVGGNGDDAVKAIYGVDELRTFVEQGGTWSRESPGAAIAYELAWVADDSPAGFALTSEYEVESCARVSQDVRVALKQLKVVQDGGDGGGELELYGRVAVAGSDGNQLVVWETDENHHVSVDSGKGWPADGEVGSVHVPVVPEAGNAITLHVKLWDDDTNGDDQLADEVIARPFEDGWRGEVKIPGAEGDQHVELVFELAPVP
ncbi:MAG TPA: thiol-activated cytolysin family protein, partial [Nannocystaceae bacterium]|nr:thiol-activated cytolysin family protein [Nannocystaceae bacterium]